VWRTWWWLPPGAGEGPEEDLGTWRRTAATAAQSPPTEREGGERARWVKEGVSNGRRK